MSLVYLVAAKPDEHLWQAKQRNDRRYQFRVTHDEAYREQKKKRAESQSTRDKEKRKKKKVGERASTLSSISTQVYAVETQMIVFQCDVY